MTTTARVAYPCGCVNANDPESGVLRSVAKCAAHRAEARDPETLDEGYYEDLGATAADAPGRYMAELEGVLGPLPRAGEAGELALEAGCGLSPYVGAIRAAGYRYLGVDRSGAAVRRMVRDHGVGAAARADFGALTPGGRCGLVLAAHCLEHLDDAPGAVAKLAAWLRPGGEAWVVVPDDSDPVNPDHLWCFSELTLRACLEAAGLEVARIAVRRVVERERFLYARARKPLPGEGEGEAAPATIPAAYDGRHGLSWLAAGELAWMVARLPERGRLVEVGTASGVSASWAADARPGLEVLCVDPFPDADAPHVAGVEPARPDLWRRNAIGRPNMTLWVGDLAGLARAAPGLRADAVLVDGGHGEAEARADLEGAAGMLARNGAIFAHDVGAGGIEGVTRAVGGFLAAGEFREAGRRGSLVEMRRT